MADIKTYSSRHVQLTYDGIAMVGLAPDGFVEFTRNSDALEAEVGADGSVAKSKSPDRTGTVKIVLQQGSPANDLLASIFAGDKNSDDFYKARIRLRDNSGMAASGKNCSIQQAPSVTRGSSASGNNVEWTFFSEDIDYA
jgi:hypothetical protein